MLATQSRSPPFPFHRLSASPGPPLLVRSALTAICSSAPAHDTAPIPVPAPQSTVVYASRRTLCP
eukprot:5185480-Pleurochrysis_carterae.AAC.1